MEIAMSPNSYVTYLQGLYLATFVDVANEYPHLRVDSDRDYKRLLSLVNTRGIQVFLRDLPNAGKHFDLCLSRGQLTKSGLPLTRPFKSGVVIPRLFKGLLLSVFDDNGMLRVDPDKRSIFFLRQLYFAAKRFRIECSKSSTWSTVDDFFKIDQEVRPPTSSWNGLEPSFEPCASVTLCDGSGSQLPRSSLYDKCDDLSPVAVDASKYLAQWASDIVASKLGWFNPSEWRTKHGPGAVSDLDRSQSKYSLPNWSEVLEVSFPYADFAFSAYHYWAETSSSDACNSSYDELPAAKLIAVPKTITAPRLIASEPVSHQWCQQSILHFLTSSIVKTPVRFSVNFHSQVPNAVLAMEASHTQSHATIDLSSASDRISCWLVERVFRRNPILLKAFRSVRTQFVTNGIDRESPSLYELRKFSTMGSALTFPVQTIIFSILAASCVHFIRGRKKTVKALERSFQEVRVYGDDIIVPTDCWLLTQAVLEDLGLKVNPNKTFGTGKFRESCGCDAYDGYDVTKVAVISMPEVSRPGSIMSSVDTHNNFFMKELWESARYIKTTVMRLSRYRIPDVEVDSGEFGWYPDPLSPVYLPKIRWNTELQRQEKLVHSVKRQSDRVHTEQHTMVLQYFTEVCKPPISHEERLGVPSLPKAKLCLGWVPL
jgi:hypothetical protein